MSKIIDERGAEEIARMKDMFMTAFPPPDASELALAIDPVFAAIAEHKTRTKESNRLEAAACTARDKAEKKHGEWIGCRRSGDWLGEATVRPFYDRWNRAVRAENKAAMRLARTRPVTKAGAAAMIVHIQRATARAFEIEDWVPIALKTVADALNRMEAA